MCCAGAVQIPLRDRWDSYSTMQMFHTACDNLDSLLSITRNPNPSLRRVSMKVRHNKLFTVSQWIYLFYQWI